MGSDQLNVSGRGRTISLVIGLTLLLGVVAGAASGYTRLPPWLIWAVILPTVYRLVLGRSRRSKATDHAAGAETLLLEAADTRLRPIQTIGPIAGVLLGAAGVSMWVRAGGGPHVMAVASTVIGLALIVVSLRSVVAWNVAYKGHAIRFQNDPCFAERLFIDGQLVARGGVGYAMVLSGTIPSGEGAGETIRATSRAGIFSFSCRIDAVSPGAASARTESSVQL